MDEEELRVLLEKEEVEYENEDEDINGDEEGILNGIIEDFVTHEGTGRLVSNYKVILRVIDAPDKVSVRTLTTALKVICEGLSVARDELMVEGGNVKKLSPEQWKSARRATIVLLFLFYKAMTNIESKVFAEHHNLSVQIASQAAKRRGKKAAGNRDTDSHFSFWDDYREKLLVQMHRLMKCPMEKLWESGINFIRAITQAVVVVVNNPQSKLGRNVDLADEIFGLLGELITRYDEESGVINRILPLIKGGDEQAKVIAYGIHLIESKFHKDRIVFSSVKEVLQIYNNQPLRETPAERAINTFLTEIAHLSPKATVHALPFVVQFLESESSTIRGAVLTVAAEILAWSKVPDSNVQEQQAENGEAGVNDFDTLRDDVLYHLVLHMKDTNALVRNKALQLATKLASDSSLYLPEIVTCAEQAKRRLMDKAATTRKFAVGLLTAAVYCDPIVIKFSSKDFRKQVRDLRKELIDLLTKNLSTEKKIKTGVREFISLLEDDDLSDVKLPTDVQSPDAALVHVKSLLEDGSIYDACQFLYSAVQEFIQDPNFKPFEKQMKSYAMYVAFFKKILNLESRDSDDEDEGNVEGNIEDEAVIESDECKAKRHYIKYLETCHSLSLVMESALPSMTILLELGTAGDKSEVIEFFAAITESGYKLDDRVTGGIIEAVAQLEQSSRADLMDCICRIFLKGCTTANQTIRTLFDILEKLPSSRREHMGVIMNEMVKSQKLHAEHFEMLWDAFLLTNPAWKKDDSKFAVFIIGVVGRVERSVISSNVQHLIDHGLGERGLDDFELVSNTCEALMILCPKQSKNPDDVDAQGPQPIRFSSEHILYKHLNSIILHGMTKKLTASADQCFQKVSELVSQLIYRTCMEPKRVVSELLASVHDVIFGDKKNESEIKDTERIICRYLNFATSLLGAHIFYHENVVLCEVKRRKKFMSLGTAKPSKAPKPSTRPSKTLSKSKSRNTTVNTSANTTAENSMTNTSQNNEMDAIIGNIGYDAETETVRGYLEKIMDTGVFKQLRTHTLFVCQNLGGFKSLLLQIAAIRALSKIMSISNVAVLKSTETFLALWHSAKNSEVKCELIRAAILLNVRFPNQMEDCNTALLAGLRDKDECVRIASLDFITFLALNDLVKVREQLTDVSLCLIDESIEVIEMAKDFLEQCGEKDNMLNNALPDIISRLSSKDDLDQQSFQDIMKFLLGRVKKDRLLLGFVEKLLLRFRASSKGRQCQDLAFCLNQLTYNDKSFKVVKDNLSSYHDKLGDEYVFDAFNTIIASLRKNAKPELKTKIDEFEKEIGVARAKCIEIDRMEAAANRKNAHSQSSRKESSDSELSGDEGQQDGENDNQDEEGEESENGTKKKKNTTLRKDKMEKNKRKRKSGENTDEDEDEEENNANESNEEEKEEEEEEEEEEENISVRRNTRGKPIKGKRRSTVRGRVAKVEESSDDGSEDEEESKQKKEASSTSSRGRRKQKAKVEESESENDDDSDSDDAEDMEVSENEKSNTDDKKDGDDDDDDEEEEDDANEESIFDSSD